MGQDRAADLRERLVQELVTGGSLRSPSWVEAFRHVARHEFLPCFFRPTDAGGWEAIDDHHPERLDLVYADATWVTQLDGDASRLGAASVGSVTGGGHVVEHPTEPHGRDA